MSGWIAYELYMLFPPSACCDSRYAVPEVQLYMFDSIMCIFPIKENWGYRQIKPLQDLMFLFYTYFKHSQLKRKGKKR